MHTFHRGTISIRLLGETIGASELSEKQLNRCFALMNQFYENVTFERFCHDLQEKQWVILLMDEGGQIQGFSTQTLLDITIDGKPIKGFFSGDTIIHKDFWGELELAKVWGQLVFSLLRQNPETEMYWFLICKGYKTYRFLPAYFNEFYPRYDAETPALERKLIDTFGQMKFPDTYNPATGVVKFQGTRDYLKHDVADITKQRLKNPHINFFVRSNPGFDLGDELVCVAKICKENMKSIVHRYYLKGQY